MNKQLRSTALMNSVLLTMMFLGTTIVNFATDNTLFGVFGIIASASTVNDVITFYKVKEN